ncbi:MAG: hypothetical protein M3167_15190 [Acidobacteriota bacterium]|nr:hypothetical protein [Acidobacteriota bacterium]
MADDDLDRELARRFEELRTADELGTPSFRGVLGRAPRGASIRGRRFALVLGAAAAAAVLAVVLLRPAGEPAGPSAAIPAAAITEWKSPTDSLLETPGSELYGEPPPAAQPIPDWIRNFERVSPGAPAPSTPRRKGVAS